MFFSGTITRRRRNIERFDEPTGISREANDPNIRRSGIDSALDAEQKIRIDIPCRACGYSLRSLALDQACPECGVVASVSIRPEGLIFADSQWLRRIARGALVFVVSAIGAVVIGAALAASDDFLFRSNLSRPIWFQMNVLAFQVAVTVVLVWAFWKLTVPQPSPPQSAGGNAARYVARLFLIVSQVGDLLADLAAQIAVHFAGIALPTTALNVLIWTPRVATSAFTLVGVLALFVYGESLARRISDDRLTNHIKIVRWGMILALALSLVHQLFYAWIFGFEYYDWSQVQALNITVSTVEYTTAVLWIVFGIWSLVLLWSFRRRFLRLANLADQIKRKR